MRIYHINGTSEASRICRCGSWLAHWLAFNERKQKLPKTCAIMRCTNPPEAGALVQKATNSVHWYVVPLCGFHCNQKDTSLELVASIAFATSNRSESCEKG
jgi:hypothetical protein